MRKFFAAAAGSVVALAVFAGAAHASATIDLIWLDTGTNEIELNGYLDHEIQLNVILTAGPTGSEGAAVSVDFSSIGEAALVLLAERDPPNSNPTPRNTPSRSPDDPPELPIELESPQIRGDRVELINSVCVCDLDLGTGLEAGRSHRLGIVTFNVDSLALLELLPGENYEIKSDADGPSDAVLDGDGNAILPLTEITFNSAFVPEPSALPVLGSGTAMLALLYRRRRYSAEP
jgi:hypothetical protein